MGYNTNEANMLQHIHLMLTQINDSVINSGGGGGGGGDVAIISSTPQLNLQATQVSVLAAVDGIEALLGTTNTNTTTNNTLTTASNTLLTDIKALLTGEINVLIVECVDLNGTTTDFIQSCYFKYSVSTAGVVVFNGLFDVDLITPYVPLGYIRTAQTSTRDSIHRGVQIRGTTTDFYPYASAIDDSVEQLASFDALGSLNTRGAVLTDEGTFRAAFSNTSLEVTIGTATITATEATGTGFDLLDIKTGDYVKVTSDADTKWVRVDMLSPTIITFGTTYTGTLGVQTIHASRLKQFKGAGTSLAVANAKLTLSAATTAASVIVVGRPIDVAPLSFRTSISISQRIANQTINVGINDDASPTRWFARFQFTGTNNTILECQTGRNSNTAPSAAETQITSVTIPTNTGLVNEYKIEFITEGIRFYVNNILVATHSKYIPLPYDIMSGGVAIINGTTPATNTDVVIDYIACKNHNKLEVGMFSDSESIVSKQPDMTETNYNVAGVIAINTDLMIIDCNNIRELNISCNAMGTTGVVTPQWSNSPLFPTPIGGNITSSLGVTAVTFNAAGVFNSPVYARYCRLRLTTATTAGTTTITTQGVAFASTKAVSLIGTSVVSISGTPAVTTSGTVRLLPATTDGFSTFYTFVMAATTNQILIATGARVVGGMTASNSSALPVFLKLFNKATAPIVGTDVPVATIMIPATSTIVVPIPPAGMRFSSGLGYAVTNLMSIVDATALPTANVVSLFVNYL